MILTRLKEVAHVSKRVRSDGQAVGFVSGVWDLTHFYHLNTFMRARAHCDFLIVGVDHDDLVMKNKEQYPGSPWYHRCWGIACSLPTDAVVVVNDMEDHDWICNQVDVVFKNDSFIYGEPVRHGTARLVILPDIDEVTSTTALKTKIVEQQKVKNGQRTKSGKKAAKKKTAKKSANRKKISKKKKRAVAKKAYAMG